MFRLREQNFASITATSATAERGGGGTVAGGPLKIEAVCQTDDVEHCRR